MRFELVHKATTYLMALTGLGTVLLSGQLPFLIVGIVLVCVLISWFVPLSWMGSARWQMAWTALTLVIFGLSLLEIILQRSVVEAAVSFLMFLVLNKLYNRRTVKDHLHLYATSFMAVVAGAALNAGLSYAICFVLHVVAAIWSLMLFQLRREMEENYLLKHSDYASSERVQVDRILRSKRIVGWKFLGGTAGGAVGVLFFALAIFLFFPRVGLGKYGWGPPRQGTMVGFSEEVSLGGHGVLRDNPDVVMRVTFSPLPSGSVLARILWRGMTFSRYDSGRWSQTPGLPWPKVHRRARMTALTDHSPDGISDHFLKAALRKAVRQRILLAPQGHTVLFGAHEVLGIAIDNPRPTFRKLLKVSPGRVMHNPWESRLTAYTVWSNLSGPGGPVMLPVRPLNRQELEAYLQQPKKPLGRDFQDLVAVLRKAGQNPDARIRAVLKHLSTANGFKYTRILPKVPSGMEPLEYFLLNTKRGHCEDFATAAALLLRALNVPPRLVNGFVGGRWNPYGRYLVVRQGDAHAWVEAHVPDRGWIPLDPTPPEGRRPVVRTGLWWKLLLWLDTLRLKYLRWVIEYDAQAQLNIFFGIRRWANRHRPSNRWLMAVVLVLIAFGAGILLWRLNTWRKTRATAAGRRTRRRTFHPASRAYRKLLEGMERRGFAKPIWQTPREFASNLHAGTLAVDLVHEATETYYTLRYGTHDQARKELNHLKALVDQALHALDTPS
jgi:hypothetical protein